METFARFQAVSWFTRIPIEILGLPSMLIKFAWICGHEVPGPGNTPEERPLL